MPSISKTDRIKLQDVSIEDIKGIMKDKYESSYSKLEILSENSDALTFLTKHSGNHASIELSRKTHRPLDLDITVRYTSTNIKDETFKSTSDKVFGSLSRIIYGVMSVVVIILLIYLVFFVGASFLSIFFGEYTLLLLLPISIALIIYQFLPDNQKFGYKQKQQKLDGLLEQVKQILLQLQENSNLETVKCWNCFEEIDKLINHCPFCGKIQN